MKIKSEEFQFVIPIDNGIALLVSEYKNELIELLTSYITNGKKNKCTITDDDGDLINPKDFAFIYISNGDNIDEIFDFKPKTMLNNEISSIIGENQEMFSSIETIRNGFENLLSDVGMFKIIKILISNTDLSVEFDINNFDLTKLLQTLCINTEILSRQKKMIMLYNMLLYLNRNKFCIIYIDFEVDDYVIEWINKSRSDDLMILIENSNKLTLCDNCIESLLILRNSQDIIIEEADKKIINRLSYCLHPYVSRNLIYQSEKNRNLIKEYAFTKQTLLIKFS